MYSIPPERVEQDKKLMIWLHQQGVTPEEMAKLCWGCVDDFKRIMKIPRTIHTIKLDLKTGKSISDDHESHKIIKWKGTDFEWLLHDSPIYSTFIFTKHKPTKVMDKKCGYSVDEIRSIIREENYIKVLTNTSLFDNIKVAKVNISKEET